MILFSSNGTLAWNVLQLSQVETFTLASKLQLYTLYLSPRVAHDHTRESKCRVLDPGNVSYPWIWKPFACIQSWQEIPIKKATVCVGGIWHDVQDIGCSSQVIIMHEKSHLIQAADRRENRRKNQYIEFNHLGR